MKTSIRRTHVVLPSRVVSAIDAVVGSRGRSRFILQAADRELRRLAQISALRNAAGSWADRDHPELREGSRPWVKAIRSEGERRLRATRAKPR